MYVPYHVTFLRFSENIIIKAGIIYGFVLYSAKKHGRKAEKMNIMRHVHIQDPWPLGHVTCRFGVFWVTQRGGKLLWGNDGIY